MTNLVLGPSKWRRGYHPEIPPWAHEFVPANWSKVHKYASSPLDVRMALSGFLEESEVSATLMEAQVAESGEPNMGFLQRLVRDLPVKRFLVYWPYGADRSGLDVEIGYLLTRLEDKTGLDVRIFVEAGGHPAGKLIGRQFVVTEHRRRTRYYDDLLTYGCKIVEWESYQALFDSFLSHGRE